MHEVTFLILTALAKQSLHGYGIIMEVKQISDGRVRIRAGTLYAALDRLANDGFIKVEKEEIVDNRLRRYYVLTPAGIGQLANVATQMQANARVALLRLNPAGEAEA
jgi:PadR family transcriptional regulator, regulatory protein PadR